MLPASRRGWRTDEVAEPRVRRLVAHCLGVGVGQLAPEVSLTDDLAADSLDLVELAITLEAEFGIVVPEPSTAARSTSVRDDTSERPGTMKTSP